jgi:DNA-binding NarL/FixJ family response regulator
MEGPTMSHVLQSTATLDDLSPREIDVIRLITQGYSNEEIGRELYVTNNTVKSFVRTAYRKIGATRRSQAVIWGFQNGLLETTVTTGTTGTTA